jgi:hypothetical protein
LSCTRAEIRIIIKHQIGAVEKAIIKGEGKKVKRGRGGEKPKP